MYNIAIHLILTSCAYYVCICTASTFRKGCPAEIKFRASEDGCHLVVTSMVIDHNHELNKVQHMDICSISWYVAYVITCCFME